jgi:DNA-binding NarL/FixJ family response regulator
MSQAPKKSKPLAKPDPVTVAMVEDEREIRESWVKLLGSFSEVACVCTCASGEDALKQLPSVRPQIVLMDIFLPRMSGIECTARLKKLLPDTHILILTSVADDEMVFMALQAGADGYLLKSTQPAELEEALRDLLRGGAPMTGAVARRVVRYFRQKEKPKDADLGLSAREEEVLILLSKGYGNKEIAAQLVLSIDTISTYLKQIYKKLHVHSRTEAVMRYTQSNVK